ncbi:peptidoglycan bridge formation glycyltransferase FemA/FemB family protein [Arthrobacter sp. TMS1-12-1]
MTSATGRRGPYRISVPSRSDPALRPLVEGIGGPLGRRTDPGRISPGWFTVERVLILLTVCAAVLAVVVKNPCRLQGWSSPDYFYRACYSDWTELYQSRGLGEGVLPFITPGALFEYPVLLGLLASGTAVLVEVLAGGEAAGASRLYFDVNAVLLAGVWILTVLATLRLAGRRPWDAAVVATAPVIVLSGTINWDLWAVLLATAGMLAFARERPVLAGILWGLGAAVKLYPVLILGAVLVLAIRTGRYRPLAGALAGTLTAWLAVNLPFLLRDPAGWGYFLTFSETRDAGFSSGWYVYNALARQAGTATLTPGVINAGAAVLFVLACAGIAVLALRARRRPRFAQLVLLIVGAFILCNKVYSPQYALWLVPLVALAVPRWRVVLAWQSVEILHWAAVWLYLGGMTGGGPAEHNLGLGTYSWAVLAHMLGVAYVMGVVVADLLAPRRDVVRRIGIDDPQGGAFDGAPDRFTLSVHRPLPWRRPAAEPGTLRRGSTGAPIGLQDRADATASPPADGSAPQPTGAPTRSGRSSTSAGPPSERPPVNEALLTYSPLDRQAFDAVAVAHPHVVIPIEQTPDWVDFERALGRTPLGIWAYRDAAGTLVATAGLVHVVRRFRESVVVVNGPVWYAERTPAAERMLLQTVRRQFRDHPTVHPLYVRLQVATLQPPATGPIEHGWYEREIVVDLTPSEGDLLKSFRPNARNSIRRAQRNGVEIKHIPREEWKAVFAAELFPIMQETAERDGFQSFDSSYYETLLTVLGDHLRLLVAYRDGQPLSWLITTEYRGYSVYYFAGSTHAARSTFAPYLLLWEALRTLKAAGNTACGLTGIESENYPSLANVTTFKRNFSKNVVVVPTTYDVPLDAGRYAAVSSLLAARRRGPAVARRTVGRVRAAVARVGGSGRTGTKV